jgi:dihydrolipoamide dehydrogenase
MKDIVIIGGGPGGYVAAIRAAQLGANVCMIEKDKFGGTCLNRGCIPTKALYKNAQVINTINKSRDFGITIDNYSINIQDIQNRKNNIVSSLVNGVEKLLQENNIEVIRGKGIIKDSKTVRVELEDGREKEIKGKNIIIATGSIPDKISIPGINVSGVITTEEMLEFEEIPQNLVIIGGGVVGMEFADIFNAIGTNVSVIEYLPNILNGVDSSISKRYKAIAKRKKINIMVNAKVTKITKDDGGLQVYYETKNNEKTIKVDKVLVAVGRKPNLSNIGLDGTGIIYEEKGIYVNEDYETSVKGVFAIGDVNGKVMLAHEASHQGIKVVEHIMGLEGKDRNEVIPSCIFVFPEIACVGLTEEEAKQKEIDVKIGKFMFSANGKAMTMGEKEGFVKIIANKDNDEILGVHILGPHASDLIHEGVLAINNNLKINDITKTIHAHPTLSEVFHEATLDVNDISLHILPKKKI